MLPAEQAYMDGSFGRGANTMVSVSEVGDDGALTSDLSFKNVGGYIYFRLYGKTGVKVNSITLTGNRGEPLAGEATVTINPGETPKLTMSSTATNSITLVCDPPVAVGTSKTNYVEFWMAVPPTEFTEGFTFTIRGGGSVIEKRVSSSVSVKRNHVVPIAAVKVPYNASNTYSVRSRESMTLKEKVGQMIMASDYAIVGSYKKAMTSTLQSRFSSYPCGGFIITAGNVQSPSQLTQYMADLHDLADYPLLSIDEEGGNVARIGLGGDGNNYTANFPEICSTNASRVAKTIGDTGDPSNAYAAGNYIGTYLREFGLDINLAPVADVYNPNTPENPITKKKRSYSSDPSVAASMVAAYLHGLQDAEVEGCLKHFPGHGDVGTDTHYGYSEITKTWGQMLQKEIIPFKRGIDNDARMIMTAHITLPNVLSEYGYTELVPSTMSYLILHDKLRVELGFDGVIITDSMGMGAITNQFNSRTEAAIRAILAGVDIVLSPADSYSGYTTVIDGIVSAVQSGRISESRINESVDRILNLKRHILAERGQLQ